VSERGMADVRKDVFKKLVTLPVYFFEENRVGDLMSRLTSDVEQLQQVFSFTLANFIRQFLILVLGTLFLFFTNVKLALLMLSTFPVIVIGALFFGRYVRKLSKERQKYLADTNIIVEESMTGIRNVKSFTNERFEKNRYWSKINEVVRIALNLAKTRGLFSSFIVTMIFGGIFFILWFGFRMVQNDALTIGKLVAFIVYTAFIGGSIAGLGNFYTQIVAAIGGTERIRQILNQKQEVEVDGEEVPVKRFIKGEVKFNHVAFSYPARKDVPVLKDISLEVKPGKKIALVGQSGSGKSTIVQLLLKYYDIDEGSILVDGKNIDSYDITAYRHHLGMVPQDVLLFGGTIRENILYGKPEANEDEIIEASKKSNSYDFIMAFPEGFDTLIGERGVKLSGGQRQRIAIARAILKDPEILILDEATSSLDSESERLVQDALNKLMLGRTSIIIAHRLSTIRDVDMIYVIENGKIIEQGTHDELTEKDDGAYQHLAKLQFEGTQTQRN
jgi:ABC-type multidrug transport system fused ATPase/permease subunit